MLSTQQSENDVILAPDELLASVASKIGSLFNILGIKAKCPFFADHLLHCELGFSIPIRQKRPRSFLRKILEIKNF